MSTYTLIIGIWFDNEAMIYFWNIFPFVIIILLVILTSCFVGSYKLTKNILEDKVVVDIHFTDNYVLYINQASNKERKIYYDEIIRCVEYQDYFVIVSAYYIQIKKNYLNEGIFEEIKAKIKLKAKKYKFLHDKEK